MAAEGGRYPGIDSTSGPSKKSECACQYGHLRMAGDDQFEGLIRIGDIVSRFILQLFK